MGLLGEVVTSTGDGDLWRPPGDEKSGEGELELVRMFCDIVLGMMERKVLKARLGEPDRVGDKDLSGQAAAGVLTTSVGKSELRRQELPMGILPRALPIPRKAGIMNLITSSLIKHKKKDIKSNLKLP